MGFSAPSLLISLFAGWLWRFFLLFVTLQAQQQAEVIGSIGRNVEDSRRAWLRLDSVSDLVENGKRYCIVVLCWCV